jgi:hypothetical protein
VFVVVGSRAFRSAKGRMWVDRSTATVPSTESDSIEANISGRVVEVNIKGSLRLTAKVKEYPRCCPTKVFGFVRFGGWKIGVRSDSGSRKGGEEALGYVI